MGKNEGSEQSGDRPVLVVDSHKTSPVCVVVPITLERLNDNKSYHIDLNNGLGTVLLEQIRAISKTRIFKPYKINDKYATVTSDEKDLINKELNKICQLKPLRHIDK